MAVMSHLSDAEEAINIGTPEVAHQQIEFAKAIIIRYMDRNCAVEESELTRICNTVLNK